MRLWTNLGLLIILLLINVWAPLINVSECLPATEPMGFWYGVWHGIVMIPAFFASLFMDGIGIYAINNNGAWYNFGYIGGLSMIVNIIAGFIRMFGKQSTNRL
jgi:hypothetical protein